MVTHVARDPIPLHKDLFIAVESLRNGYDLLHRTLHRFLGHYLDFVPQGTHQTPYLLEFYLTLGVHPDVAGQLAAMQVFWSNGKLQISEHMQGTKGLLEKLATCILSVMRFKKCTDSRWVSVGSSCASILAALAVGLDQLVSDALSSPPGSTTYYLCGFRTLQEPAMFY